MPLCACLRKTPGSGPTSAKPSPRPTAVGSLKKKKLTLSSLLFGRMGLDVVFHLLAQLGIARRSVEVTGLVLALVHHHLDPLVAGLRAGRAIERRLHEV